MLQALVKISVGVPLALGALASSALADDAAPWRLSRIADPRGGPDTVSITRVMDLPRSDPNLAGLVIRCRAQRAEVLIMVIDPLPPSARPMVVIDGGGHETTTTATPIPTGAGLVLPIDAESLVQGPWRRGGDVRLRVTQGTDTREGVISADGLSAAFVDLMNQCAP